MAQVDYFLKIPEAPGESPDSKHSGEIEVVDFSFGVQQLGTSAFGGGANVIPNDSIALNFSKIEIEYKEQKPDGTLGGATKGNFDLKTNKAA